MPHFLKTEPIDKVRDCETPVNYLPGLLGGLPLLQVLEQPLNLSCSREAQCVPTAHSESIPIRALSL